ncbi:MAG: TonB-dependent receptor [Acidobacteria bacterium]|nr:MAG: TonB-dependent receptor [Acidobacteriota bacterium]MCE7958919.1 TonB-dependent receptor [Acidobacteria bacterium ACB2]
MHRTLRGAVAPLLFVLLALPALARDVRFRLVDSTGAPVVRARVSVLGRTGSATTGPEGEFRLDPVPPLPFEVAVSDERGAWLGLVRVVELGDQVSTTLTLPPPTRTEVVVRAGLAPTTIAPPAAAPSVVSRTEMEEKRPERLADALAEIPGTGKLDEGQTAVPSIRGMARSRVLLLVDDARVTSERRAGPSASYLDPFSLENVEVVRGPGSVAYGSDALGGILHSRTPMPTADALGGRFELSGGLAGSAGATGGVEANVPVGEAALLLQAHQRFFDDYEAPSGTIENSSSRDRGVLLRGMVPIGAARVFAGVQLDQGRDTGKPSLDSNVTETTYPEEDSLRVTVGADLPGLLGFTAVEVRAFWGRYDLLTARDRLQTATDPRRLSESDVEADDASFRAVGSRPLGRGSLRVGLDASTRFSLEALNTYTDYDMSGDVTGVTGEVAVEEASKVDLGAFVETEQPLVSGLLSVSAGLRGDQVRNRNRGGYFGDRSTSDGALSGFAAATVTPLSGLSVTAQYARGFRDPLLSDRYYRGISGRGFVTGNPDLVPETSNQYDLAARYSTGPFSLAAYAYLYRIQDLIERYKQGTDYYFRNRGEEELTGAELELSADAGKGLQVRLALGTTRGTILDDGSAAADVPPSSAVLTLDWAPTAEVWVRGRLSTYAPDDRPGPTEKPTPGYAVVDLAGGYRFPFGIEARLLLRNVLDKSYPGSSDELSVDAPGFGASLVLAGTF